MKNLIFQFAAALSLLPCAAQAEEQPRAGVLPAWVTPASAPQSAAAPPENAGAASDQPLRVLLEDQQVWFSGPTTSLYQHRILRVDRPEGVQAMQHLAVQWRAQTDRLTIHTFRLTRAGRENDLLGAVREVLGERLPRYGGLRMDGERSLGLPIAGMQVGDIVEIAYTIDRNEPLLGGHHEMVLDAGSRGGIDRLMLSARWEDTMPMAVAGRNLPAPLVQAPGRAQMLASTPLEAGKGERLLAFSDFRQWADVAAIFQPLFAQARQIAPDSPIRAEVARIAAASRDPRAQADMALASARSQVQYLYSGLGEGNLRPMAADHVWQRGFADCKGKAALLLALLDGLGIPAEPALVATRDGDKLDRALPTLAGFDHVIVRAEIGGRVVWLDPTLEGAERAAQLGWALPVRGGAGLEAMKGVRAAWRGRDRVEASYP